MESSHIPLHKWALAFRPMAGSKKGVSPHQLMRELGFGSCRTAWFMAHRIREGEKLVTTNTVEGFFGVFKRGMTGVYQHCAEHHLQKYLNEFDFRYSNRIALGVDDANRASRAVKGAIGKRLTYQGPSQSRTGKARA